MVQGGNKSDSTIVADSLKTLEFISIVIHITALSLQEAISRHQPPRKLIPTLV